MTNIPTMGIMAKKTRALVDQIRQAVVDADLTRYRISQITGIDNAALSRFVHGERGLSEESLNSLGELLGLEIRIRRKKKGR